MGSNGCSKDNHWMKKVKKSTSKFWDYSQTSFQQYFRCWLTLKI